MISSAGISVAHRDAEGHTPLHWAAYQNQEPVARLLISLGADVKSVDDEGLTPLHWAALKVIYLHFHGLGVCMSNENHILCALQGHYQMVQFLIINGANVHLRDSDDLTALDLAKQKNMKNTVSLLKHSSNFTSTSEVSKNDELPFF